MKIISAAWILGPKGRFKEARFGQNQAVIVDQGLIVTMGSHDELTKQFPQAEAFEFPDAVLMPGLVNAHTQLELLSFDPSGKTKTHTEWLIQLWNYRKRLTPSERRANLLEGIEQLIRVGTTCVGDVGTYVGVLPSLPKHSMRMVLFPELFTSAEKTIQTDYEAVFTQVDEIAALDNSRIRRGLAPYAPYTLSSSLLKIFAKHAQQQRIPTKIHAAESFAEMQFFYESTGELAEQLFPKLGWADSLPPAHRKTPIQFLDSISYLDKNSTLLGCIQTSDGDIQLLQKREAKVVFTPRSQALLQFGSLPLKKLRRANIPIGLGTDSSALQSVSLWDEMRFVLDHEKDYHLSATDLLQMATLESAEVLGLGQEIGSLEPNKRADLIAVRLPKKFSSDQLPSLAEILIRETGPIEAVFIDGETIKAR